MAHTHRFGTAIGQAGGSFVKWLWSALLPELRQFQEVQREQALQRARGTSLDVIELVGMAVGLVVVTALTKYIVPNTLTASRIALSLISIAVAMPLMVAALGPFHLRRLRRGLRTQLQNQCRR